MKRAVDIAGGSLGLLLLGPVLLLTALTVRLAIGSPVLFRQARPGLHGRPFTLLKFRTMQEAHDERGHPLPDDVRLTRLGRFLRSTSLDELPALWNVLRGEMSLVGPRPLLTEYLPLYTPRQAKRHEVRPGITGWAQVNGRNALDWDQRLELDAWYVEHRTFLLDLRIIALTALKVVFREGISQEGHATMPKFRGSAERASAGAMEPRSP
jgi:lipopolysaccharide/colanic/teichoic acid biosynthesis glycosyltransferase